MTIYYQIKGVEGVATIPDTSFEEWGSAELLAQREKALAKFLKRLKTLKATYQIK